MSRSSYQQTTSSNSGAVYDRDYDERKERERDRTRNADRYESDSRHHGKWTAEGETVDLENSSSLPGAYYDARRSSSSSLGRSSFSDRENYGNQGYGNQGYKSRSANYNSYDNYGNQGYGNQGYDQGYGMGYGQIPNPPPMPARDFWRQGGYRNQHPYYPQYGHSNYDGSNFAGMHPQSNHSMFRGTGNFAQDIRQHAGDLMHISQGYNHGYGLGYDQGYDHGFGYGSREVSPSVYGMSSGLGHIQTGHQSYEYLSGGYPSQMYGGTRHLELGTTRPHVDIYELGNEYIIEMDMPGHTRDHIETKLFGNELVVTSRPPKRDLKYHINERPLGRHEVTRKFYLPSDVNSTRIGATLTNGVLRVTLPRGAPAQTTPSTTTVVDTTTNSTTTTQTAATTV